MVRGGGQGRRPVGGEHSDVGADGGDLHRNGGHLRPVPGRSLCRGDVAVVQKKDETDWYDETQEYPKVKCFSYLCMYY